MRAILVYVLVIIQVIYAISAPSKLPAQAKPYYFDVQMSVIILIPVE